MDTNGFDQDENETGGREAGPLGPPSGEELGRDQPTVPGLDPTENIAPIGSDRPSDNDRPSENDRPAENQPKWQPLPGGGWAPPPQQPYPAGHASEGPSGEGYAGYGPPGPYGYGASSGYGQGGYGPGGEGGWPGGYATGEPPEPSNRRSRTTRRVITGLAVAILIAAAASIGVVVGSSSNTSATGKRTATDTIPSPSTKGISQTKPDVSKIASQVDPATVDITSVLGGQDAEAEGTGMVLTPNGEVLTNNHVIEDGTKITAQVDGAGTRYTVKVLGTDVTDDVALVQLEGASHLTTVKIGNSADVKVGDPVVAIGNALGLGGTPTVTSGIISALGRSINASDEGSDTSEHLKGMLQTDAPINPGNSGGPLVDAAGQVIGMDTAAYTGSETQTASNIGFAIPIDEAISIAQAIQQGHGSSTILIGPKAIIGVDVLSIQQVDEDDGNFFGGGPVVPVNYGAYVEQVVSNSPAAAAGIVQGDVIIDLNGNKVESPTALGDALQHDHPGTQVSVTWVTSSGAKHTSTLTLEADPAAV